MHGQIPLLAGCSSSSLIAGGRNLRRSGLVLVLCVAGSQLKAFHFTQASGEANGPGYWHLETGIGPGQTNGWLVFADPFNLDSEAWLQSWNEAFAPLPVLGGLASGDYTAQQTQVYLNGEVYEEGGVAISIGGDVRLAGIISQGCTPIGETWTLTKVERNLIHEIGNRAAYEVLAETFNELSADGPASSAAIFSSAWSSTNIWRSFIAVIFWCAIFWARIPSRASWSWRLAAARSDRAVPAARRRGCHRGHAGVVGPRAKQQLAGMTQSMAAACAIATAADRVCSVLQP